MTEPARPPDQRLAALLHDIDSLSSDVAFPLGEVRLLREAYRDAEAGLQLSWRVEILMKALKRLIAAVDEYPGHYPDRKEEVEALNQARVALAAIRPL